MTRTEFCLCAALVAVMGVGCIAGVNAASAALNKVEQRIAFRNCLLTQPVEVCTAARPLGAGGR